MAREEISEKDLDSVPHKEPADTPHEEDNWDELFGPEEEMEQLQQAAEEISKITGGINLPFDIKFPS